MLYQLPNGKVIEISTEQFLDMSDQDIEYLVAFNAGDVIEDPFFGSSLSKHGAVEEIDEDFEVEIPDMTAIERFIDLDIDGPLLEE